MVGSAARVHCNHFTVCVVVLLPAHTLQRSSSCELASVALPSYAFMYTWDTLVQRVSTCLRVQMRCVLFTPRFSLFIRVKSMPHLPHALLCLLAQGGYAIIATRVALCAPSSTCSKATPCQRLSSQLCMLHERASFTSRPLDGANHTLLTVHACVRERSSLTSRPLDGASFRCKQATPPTDARKRRSRCT